MKDFYPETAPVTALFVDGRYNDALNELERLWDAIPDPKTEILNSYLAVSFGAKIALKLGSLDEARKWSQRGLAFSGCVNQAGESEFLAGEVAFARGDMVTAAAYFEAASRFSGWRLFKGENPAYRRLVEKGAGSHTVECDGSGGGENDPAVNDAIHMAVWSGYCNAVDVEELIGDLVDEGGDANLLRKAAKREFDAKLAAEKRWPEQTDCDLLERAFAAIEKRGILCLQNAGYTMEDGHQEAFEALSERRDASFTGYCFFHGQDLERAIRGEGLMLAFDHVDGEDLEMVKVGRILKEELERVGFEVSWSGAPDDRICIPGIQWLRRYRAS